MPRLKVARRKRFKIRQDQKLSVYVRHITGELIKGSVKDVSATGLLAELSTLNETLESTLGDGQILPDGKFVWDGGEHPFGRTIVKFLRKSNDAITLGLMFADTQLDTDGHLSRFFHLDLDPQLRNPYLEIESEGASLADFLGVQTNSRDIFAKATRYSQYLGSLERNERWGYWIPRKPSKGIRIRLNNPRSDGRDDFIIMASNDYLGLSSRSEVVAAATEAMGKYGFGATGSSVTCGQTELHEALQDYLAKIFRTERAMLFNSGYAANIGIISSLVGPGDIVIADILSHASIYDGMLLSQGVKRFFKHNDTAHFRRILERSREEAAGALLIVEGVFSMEGDTAPLSELASIAREFDVRVMIDEAHSLGILGKTGLGLSEEASMLGGIDITMGTFSKICGGIGGFACGSKDLVNWLNVSARSSFFSVALPPSTVAAAKRALEIFFEEPGLIGKLRHNIEHFTDGLRRIGFDVPTDHRSAIVPVIIGDEKKLGQMYRILYDSGVYTIPVVYPAVNKNGSRFRFTVSAEHSVSDIDYVLLVIKRAVEQVGLNLSKLKSDRLVQEG